MDIIALFKKHGHLEYGEECSVLSHSMQAGMLAKEKGYDEELILAAFLHDIGHLYPLELNQADFEKMGTFGVEAHDLWGAKYLSLLGFSDQVVAMVKNHVASKRYLCAVDQSYKEQLSEASKETLAYQGGPMNEAEVQQFERDPFFEESILIRKIDEEAKGINFVVTEDHYNYLGELLDRHLMGR